MDRFITLRRAAAMLLIAGALLNSLCFHVSDASSSRSGRAAVGDDARAKVLLSRLESSFAAATAFEYQAVVSAPITDKNGNVGKPVVCSITCLEQKPDWQFQTIRQHGKVVGTIIIGPSGGLFLDNRTKRYLKLHPISSPADYAVVHRQLDDATESSFFGNLFDSTLLNHPMFSVADQYNRDSPVRYTVVDVTVRGQRAYAVTSSTTAGAQPLTETTYIGKDNRLLGYTVTARLVQTGGKPMLIVDEQFTRLQLLKSRVPASRFATQPPPGYAPLTQTAQ